MINNNQTIIQLLNDNNSQTIIQYASDLHLEHELYKSDFKDIITPKERAEILILAGDICNPTLPIFIKFMRYCCTNWKYVIMIPGNHEYYKSSINSTNIYIQDLSKKIKFYFLNNSNFIIRRKSGKHIVIIGTPLWSFIPDNCFIETVTYLNDFKYIKELKCDHYTYNILHKYCKSYINTQLNDIRFENYIKVVVSHHAPIEEITSSPIYRGKSTNKAFASDCNNLVKMADVWIFGHTHYNPKLIVQDNCRVLSNQRGYRGNCRYYRKEAFFCV